MSRGLLDICRRCWCDTHFAGKWMAYMCVCGGSVFPDVLFARES
jgi:hypothetical protein